MTSKHALTALVCALLIGAPASTPGLAQGDGPSIPPICGSGAMDMGATKGGMGMMGGMGPGQQMMAEGMDRMNAAMMTGMTRPDMDVAFVCSMIPHHQGAIDMARAELANGDDPWVREMAEKVIDAQTQEIADMIAWLEKQPK